MLFSAKKEVQKLSEILSNSFQNVKADMTAMQGSMVRQSQATQYQLESLNQWVEYLNSQNQVLTHELARIRHHMQTQAKPIVAAERPMITKHEIKETLDYYYHFEHLIKKVRDLDEAVGSIHHKVDHLARGQ